jgi:hypothetical protein
VNYDYVRRDAYDIQRETPHSFGVSTGEPIFKMNIAALFPAGL